MEARNILNRELDQEKFKLKFNKKRKVDKIFSLLALFASLLGLLLLFIFFASVLYKGASWLNLSFLLNGPSRFPEKAGILPALVGSFWLIMLTALFSIPLGIGTAIFLEEYSNRNFFARLIQINISNLAGVPSVIYGILGLAFFVRFLALGRSILAGSLTMSLLVLPIIIIATQEALKTVPRTIREASFSLGATRWQTVRHAVIPIALPGILTGIILALARAIGETAPLIGIGALSYVAFVPRSPTDPFTVLPVQIYTWVSRPQKEFQEIAAAAIIVLLLLFILLNALVVFLRHKSQRKVR